MNDSTRDDLFGRWSVGRRSFWAGAAGLAILIFGWPFLQSLRPPPTTVLDFFQEYASARNYFEGLPVYTEQPVAVQRYLGYTLPTEGPYRFIKYNAHPPPSVLLALPLARLSYSDAFFVWNLLTLACLTASVLIIVRQLNVRLSPWSLLPFVVIVLATNPVRQQFNQGQLNAVLLLLTTAAWAADRTGRPVTAGALVGAATAVKLFPGFLFLFFLSRRQWLSLAAGGLTFLALTGLTAAVLGVQTYLDYCRDVLPNLAIYRDVWLNSSFSGYWHKLFNSSSGHTIPLWHSPALALGGTVASCAVLTAVLAVLTWRARTREEQDLAFGLTLNGMLLVSPITWDHYFILLTLPALLLWLRLRRGGLARVALGVMLLALFFDPDTVWRAVTGGPGVRTQQVATAWQTLGIVSHLFYALLGLFLLGARELWRSQHSRRQVRAAAFDSTPS
jgi:alpha-1,2-mannosyltransferase